MLKDTVDGEGVIGLYPIIKKGMQMFTYQSCSYSGSALGGTMEGWFEFEDLNTHEKFNCMIDPFPLTVLERVRIPQ